VYIDATVAFSMYREFCDLRGEVVVFDIQNTLQEAAPLWISV
jgi:hypothetical protein